MDDRKLMELAAKAAGLEFAEGESENSVFEVQHDATRLFRWNPLEDDGDAFRLAVDLGLRIYPIARTASGQACSAVADASGVRLADVVDVTSTRVATRRAIVLAAAEIGKSS